MDELKKQALTEHLAELRQCLVVMIIAVVAGFAVAYYFIMDIGRWFLAPLYEVLPKGTTLIFTSYQEAFFFI